MRVLGRQIKDLRTQHQLTLKQLSQRSNISVSYLCDIEKGRSNPSLETLQNIATALKTTPSALFSGNSYTAESAVTLDLLKVPLLKNIQLNQPLLDPLNIEKYIYTSTAPYSTTDSFIFFRVNDDSMIESRLLTGDLVLVRMNAKLNPGDLVLFAVKGEEACVRRYYPLEKHTILTADNPNIKPAEINDKTKARILGKVIRAILSFE